MTESTELNQLALQRAKRLKVLRQMTGLTMQEFAEKSNVGQTTLNYWENAISKGGLTERGARKVIEALKNEGINCNIIWLLEGVGDPPRIADQTKLTKLNQQILEISSLSQPENISEIENNDHLNQEIACFQQIYPNSLIHVVTDNAMSPFYNKGDVVGGKRLEKFAMDLANGMDCIVDLGENKTVLRRIKLGTRVNTFSGYCLNPEATIYHPALTDIQPHTLAPIIRIWRQLNI